MNTKKTPKAQPDLAGLTPLEKIRASRMVFPNGMPLTMTNVRSYLEQLKIEPVLAKVDGKGQEVLHVSEAQAQALETLFKAKHWRKFKEAEKQ